MTIAIEPNARILVINVARIGDTLMTTPVLRAIKAAYPDARVGCLAHPKRAAVLQGLPWVDRLGVITPKRARWRGWLSAKFWDYAIVYGRDAPLIRYALRVARRVIAFEQGDATLDGRLWRAVPMPRQRLLSHVVHEHLLLPAALGIETDDHRLAYFCSDAETDEAKAWLEAKAPGATRLVGFQVASFPTKSYRDWPLENFAGLGRRVLDHFPGSWLVVLGGAESVSRARWLRQQLGRHVVVAAGRMSLRQSAALMQRLDLYVGVDTGPTHLAGALGIPMVALYHCFHRSQRFAPAAHPRLRAIDHPASDAQCSRESDMADITVDRVWECVQELLGADAAASRASAPSG
ncbi:MAG TPA: glycosyltransferase family 9 protein [Candidatus Methylomirabilis sp.]|nr:glycosyltransferase family 9 protein [Candidatus Methylomirabilis sp.]